MKAKLIFIICLAVSLFTFAQKSAPVAGDAAILIDLLKKDYNTINPETRDDEIMRDRARVIGIFKSYLEDSEKEEINSTEDITIVLKDDKGNDINKNHSDLVNDLTKTRNNLQTLKAQSVNLKASELSVYKGEIKELETNIFIAKKNLISISYKKDNIELDKLIGSYKSGNLYLEEVIKVFKEKYDALNKSSIDGYSEINYQSSIQKSLPFLGGDLAFETVIDGLSRFLANRIKEELTTYVIQEIQNRLNNPSPQSYLNELMVLLPRTTDYLKKFDADQVLNFIDESKQYIEDDLNNMLTNTSNLRNTPRFVELIKNNPELGFAFEALELIPQLSKVKNPIDYFDIFENSTLISDWSSEGIDTTKKKISIGIRLVSMLAHSLTVLDNGELKFATIDFMSNYGSEPNFYKLYIGFLHQQNIKYYKDITFKGKDKNDTDEDKYLFKIVMNNTKEYQNKIKGILPQIITPAERLYNDAISIKKASDNNEKVPIETVHNFIEGTISLSEAIVKNTQELFDKAKELDSINKPINIKKPIKKYFQLARISNDIFLDLHNKKYSIAILKALEIYPALINNKNQKLPSIVFTSEALFKNQKILTNTIGVLKKEKYPKKDEEIAELKDIALTLELLLKKIEWGNSSITNNNTYKGLKALLKSVNEDNTNKDYKNNLTSFKTKIKANPSDFINSFTPINIDKLSILESIDEFIDKNIEQNPALIKQEIRDNTKEFVDKFLLTAFENATLDFESIAIDEKKDYLKALNDLTRTIQVLIPEIIQEAFNIRDNKTIKLVHFLNDIALSESSEDVEKAISAFALPSGSFALKQKKGPFIAINSFPGILIGSEQRNFSNSAFTIGFTAPIGLYTKIGNGRWGLFAPIIDIAAPVRFRLDDDNSTETLPEFSFKNILSPGLYITHRIGKSPFTLNAGGQIGPELQKIEEGSTVNFSDSFRVGIGFTLDIPLLTLYRRPKID